MDDDGSVGWWTRSTTGGLVAASTIWIAAIACTPASAAEPSLRQLEGKASCVHVRARACTRAAALGQFGALAISPDGRHVYATGHSGREGSADALVILRRNRRTGTLRPIGCLSDAPRAGCAPAPGIDGPSVVSVSPDGRQVYVAASGIYEGEEEPADWRGTLVVFARRAATGRLVQVDCFTRRPRPGCPTLVDTLGPAEVVTPTPDGSQVLLDSPARITVFSRDRQTGALAPSGCVGWIRSQRCPDGAVLPGGPTGAMFASPDSRFVYLSHDLVEPTLEIVGAGLGVLARDRANGSFSLRGCLSSVAFAPCRTERRLADDEAPEEAELLAMSPDARFLYTSNAYGPGDGISILVLRAPPGGGAPRVVGCLGERKRRAALCSSRSAVGDADHHNLVLSPDGRRAVAGSEDTLAVLRRDPRTGRLLPVRGRRACIQAVPRVPRDQLTPDFPGPAPPRPPCQLVRGAREPAASVFSPDGRHAYGRTQNGIVAFRVR
jgi:hypothetical protein